MSLESRSRMISFRLSEEEHERFRELCLTHGIRSVSELARVAMNRYFEKPSEVPNDAIEARIADLENRLHMLAIEVHKLTQPVSLRTAKPLLH